MAQYGDGRSTSSRDALSAIALRFIDEFFSFVCSMNHIPPYLFLSRHDDDNVGDIGEHDFRSILLHPEFDQLPPMIDGIVFKAQKCKANQILLQSEKDYAFRTSK